METTWRRRLEARRPSNHFASAESEEQKAKAIREAVAFVRRWQSVERSLAARTINIYTPVVEVITALPERDGERRDDGERPPGQQLTSSPHLTNAPPLQRGAPLGAGLLMAA